MEIPSKYRSGKNITLYKAFCLEEDEDMNIDSSIDIFGLTQNAAIRYLLETDLFPKREDVKNFTEGVIEEPIKLQICSLKFNTKEFESVPLITNGAEQLENENLLVSLSNKNIVKMMLQDVEISMIHYKFNPENEIISVGEFVTSIDF